MGSSEVLVYRDPLPGLRHAERKNTAANECNSAAKSEWGHWDFRVQAEACRDVCKQPESTTHGRDEHQRMAPKAAIQHIQMCGHD
eukprot:CAMPEP_0117499112 /NCGR_PEP_ID=MMETSP0784-20121206/22070_1 /TAXON_ID=39447 /ORGANISM="" /LENGTH=84 /DNA_ID=CAMNT_0005294235 /DNA_START=200 /DNA_END=454 /DNA_ORIENTATION=-